MRILLYEDNLLWSVRLERALKTLGHDCQVLTQPLAEPADLAIVNLSSAGLEPGKLISQLTAQGVKTIGHAGHKEKDLHQLGREAGCQTLATNGEMAHKLAEVIAKATG